MDKTILIVDDVMLNIDLLTGILGEHYKIMAAVSGESAIKILERKKPDIVLLDISMPGIDGFGVLKFMKERTELSNIPVIFITGERNSDSEEKGLSLGAVDYIKKPFNAAVVEARVKSHLELKAYRDNLEELVKKRTKQLQSRTELLEERTTQLEHMTKQITASRNAVIMGMALMSESHDRVTGAHIERIKMFTKLLTDKLLELHPEMITHELAELTVLYSTLHDVGKVSISDVILKKTGTLTAEEFNLMKRHTIEGAALLRKTKLFFTEGNDGSTLQVAIEIAECHHEKFDGMGYPYGLKGDEIPLSARVVAITDVYDALRSVRPYKKPYTHEEAMQIMLEGDERIKPGHFDPVVLDVFRIVGDSFKAVFETGEFISD